MDEDSSGNSELWTLILMAPAFFYHKEGSDNARKDFENLMAPLQDILPTLSATLLTIFSRILAHGPRLANMLKIS